ncbi:MAG TPA: MBL fold metallo-hydrolase [Bryobacteraceae bacterium]|jgi:cyclase|nr:MBL fold metallo-hydrolase [Bryobacteraceae bacterium]
MKTTLFALSFALLGATVYAQAPQPDFSKVEIKTTKISNTFYTLEGQGGTIGVLVGPDGIFMVDSQFAPLSQKIAAAIHQISDKPIRFMVNTHVHGDHTGGNENFAKLGATIFSRDELRWRLEHPAPGANGAPGVAAPAAALPVVTYEGPVTIHMDGEDVHLVPILRAHTDGDTLVYFPNNDVLMTGDYFRSIQFPNIDRTNGGSLSGMIEGLGITIGMAGPNTKIIPGHGPTVDRAALIAHRDMILAIRNKVAVMVQQGKSVEEVLAAKPTSDFDSIPNASTTSERFVRQLYAELKTN